MCTTISPSRFHSRHLGRWEARSGAGSVPPGRARGPRSVARTGPRATPSARAMYRRRRVSLALLVVLVVAPLWMVVGPAAAAPGAPDGATAVVIPHTPGVTIHVVAAGDTLWSIARSYAPDGDVRRAVDELARINGGTDLRVGDRLVIPW